MRLSHRPTQWPDLEACLPLVRDRFLHDSKSRKDLLALWRYWLKAGACNSSVVEDLDQSRGKRVVGFGLSFFAADSFARQVKEGPRPYVPLRVLEKWRQRSRFFLGREGIRKANSAGALTNVVLHYGWDDARYNDADCAKIFLLLPEAYLAMHAGYGLQEVMHEVYGAKERDALLTGGFRLYRDHPQFRADPSLAGTPENRHPYLMGVSRRARLAWQGELLMSMLFNKPILPRFYFNSAQQEVLLQALPGATDGDIAQTLRLSPWTVKKRWQGIYEKVESADPEILGEDSTPVSGQAETRQRRRHLLNYLRNHPEELRPFSRPRPKSKSSS